MAEAPGHDKRYRPGDGSGACRCRSRLVVTILVLPSFYRQQLTVAVERDLRGAGFHTCLESALLFISAPCQVFMISQPSLRHLPFVGGYDEASIHMGAYIVHEPLLRPHQGSKRAIHDEGVRGVKQGPQHGCPSPLSSAELHPAAVCRSMSGAMEKLLKDLPFSKSLVTAHILLTASAPGNSLSS